MTWEPRHVLTAGVRAFGYTSETILAYERWEPLATDRQILYWIARAAGVSYPLIGLTFARAPETIAAGVRKIDELLEAPAVSAALVGSIEQLSLYVAEAAAQDHQAQIRASILNRLHEATR